MAVFDVSKPPYDGDIQKAIDACKASKDVDDDDDPWGGTVYIPTGEYSLNHTLVVDSPMTILGDGPWSTILKGSPNYDNILVATGNDKDVLYGFSILNLGFECPTPPETHTALLLARCWGATLQSLHFRRPRIGLLIKGCGPVDVSSVYVNDARKVAISIMDCDSDVFLSKIHVNNGRPPQELPHDQWHLPEHWNCPDAVGLLLNRVSGAQVTDSDYIGGLMGVWVKAEGEGARSCWNKFTAVSADSTRQDPWFIEKAEGLQMTNCWSGSFIAGTGIWIGPNVRGITIHNHQWNTGKYGVGNWSASSVLSGGMMVAITEGKINSYPADLPWPKVFNVLNLDSDPPTML